MLLLAFQGSMVTRAEVGPVRQVWTGPFPVSGGGGASAGAWGPDGLAHRVVLLLRFDRVWSVQLAPALATPLWLLLTPSPFVLSHHLVFCTVVAAAAATYDCVRHLGTMSMAGVIGPVQPARCARL